MLNKTKEHLLECNSSAVNRKNVNYVEKVKSFYYEGLQVMLKYELIGHYITIGRFKSFISQDHCVYINRNDFKKCKDRFNYKFLLVLSRC